MSTPQSGIFDEDNPHQRHLEWVAKGKAAPETAFAALDAFISTAERYPGPAPVCEFGPNYWGLIVPAVEEGSPNAGASIAVSQRWRHELTKFNALAVPEQEAMVGRTKIDDIEKAMKIFRRSAPCGETRDQGLFFEAFACRQLRIQIQLERMCGMTDDGVHYRFIEFSQALSGSYWYVPSADTLAATIGA